MGLEAFSQRINASLHGRAENVAMMVVVVTLLVVLNVGLGYGLALAIGGPQQPAETSDEAAPPKAAPPTA